MGAVKFVGEAALDSDAEFRTWGTTLAAAFVTAGLIQTSDTGQINWTTATRGSGGYEIWRFNDAAQATYPLFMKIIYTPVATSRPAIDVSCATSTNGAGTLTGTTHFSNRQACGGNSASAGETADYYVSGGDGYFWYVGTLNTASTGVSCTSMFAIERSTDETGTVKASEGITCWNTPTNGRNYSTHPFGFTGNSTGSFMPFYPLMVDDQSGSDVGILPVPYIMRAQTRYHRHCLIMPGRTAYGTAVSATHLGAVRQFMALELRWHYNSSNGWWNNSIPNAPGILMPWS